MFSASMMVETIRRTGVSRSSPTWRRVSSVVYVSFVIVSHLHILRVKVEDLFYLVSLDMSSPLQAEVVGCFQHARTVHRDLSKVKDDAGRRDLGQLLADKPRP